MTTATFLGNFMDMFMAFINSIFGLLAIDLGGGIRLDYIIIACLVISMFAGAWFKGQKG